MPLMLKSELPITGERKFREPRRCSLGLMERPLIFKSELPITRELRGWSLGLMGRP